MDARRGGRQTAMARAERRTVRIAAIVGLVGVAVVGIVAAIVASSRIGVRVAPTVLRAVVRPGQPPTPALPHGPIESTQHAAEADASAQPPPPAPAGPTIAAAEVLAAARTARDTRELLEALLARAGSTDLAQILIDALDRAGPDEVAVLAAAVAEHGGKLGVYALLRAWERLRDLGSRKYLRLAFGCIRDPASLPLLADVVRTGVDPELAEAAVFGIGGIGTKDAARLLTDIRRDARDPRLVGTIDEAIAAWHDPAGTPILADLVRDNGAPTELRRAATIGLVSVGEATAAQGLVDAMIDVRDLGMKQMVAEALATLTRPEAAPPLVETLARRDLDADHLYPIAYALGHIGSKDAVRGLVELGRTAVTPDIAQVAQSGLRNVDRPDAAPLLADIALDPSSPTGLIAGAGWGLGKIGTKDTIRDLVRVIVARGKGDYSLQQDLVAALGNVRNHEAVQALVEASLDTALHWEVRVGALQALGELAKGEHLPLLDKLAHDPETYVEVQRASQQAVALIRKRVEQQP